MKASEARKIAKEVRHVNMAEYFNKIKVAASFGNNSTQIDLKDKNTMYCDELIQRLKAEGYEVNRTTGHDQRDGDSWDYININW